MSETSMEDAGEQGDAEWIRRTLETEGEYAMTLVEGELRDLAGVVAAAALGRFVPSYPTDGETTKIVRTIEDRTWDISATKEGRFVRIDLSFRNPKAWDPEGSSPVAAVSVVRSDGIGHWSKGRCMPDRLPELFAFVEGDPAGTDEPLPKGSISLLAPQAVEGAVAADGGYPGSACRALVVSRLRALRTSVLRTGAHRILSVAGMQRDAGLEWGKAWLAYDDTDKRCTRIPCADGRVAVLHQDIYLIADHSAFVAGVEVDEAGAPTRIEAWLIERGVGSMPAVVEAFSAGTEPPPGVLGFSYDIRTDEFGQPSDLEGYGMESTIWYGLESDLRATTALAAGELELGGYNRLRTSFDLFEPEPSEEDEEEDAPSGP